LEIALEGEERTVEGQTQEELAVNALPEESESEAQETQPPEDTSATPGVLNITKKEKNMC